MVFWRIGSVASTLRAMLVRRVIARHWSGKNPFLAEAYPAVQQAVGAANGYGDLVAGPELRRSASANRLEQGCNLDVPARKLLNGDFTFCPIRNFKGLNR